VRIRQGCRLAFATYDSGNKKAKQPQKANILCGSFPAYFLIAHAVLFASHKLPWPNICQVSVKCVSMQNVTHRPLIC